MATITFDTLKYVERLKAAGVSDAQAKAEAEALQSVLFEALDMQLASKSDITRLERQLDGIDARMNARSERIDGEMKLNRWMLGLLLAGVISLIMKSFFTG